MPVLAEREAAVAASRLAMRAVRARHASGAAWKMPVLRSSQRPPDGAWSIWLLMAGRGFGKSLAGACDVASYGLGHPGSRIAIVAPTYADARDTCVEGVSGLLSVLPPGSVAAWNRSLGELSLTNGARYKLFSADEPARLRGPQHHRAWCDELGVWPYPETFDMLMLGLRLGDDPRCLVTTTPRPTALVRDLVRRVGADVALTAGATYENLENLAPAFAKQIVRRYEGSRLGRQELGGELLEDVEGALWTLAMIDALRTDEHPDLVRVVVGVDPQGSTEEGAAETGIVVAGLGVDGHGYVLADLTVSGSPGEWAAVVCAAYRRFRADRIVGEVNNGGEMVGHTIATVDPRASFKAVHASRGKQTRAEPVAALYEQRRIHHAGSFPALEDQMTTWVPGMKSPDRMDALVWALTELMIDPTPSKRGAVLVQAAAKGWSR